MALKNKYLIGVIYGLMASIIWAAFPVMTRFGVAKSNFDEWDMTFIRFFLSGLIAIPYLLFKFKSQNPVKVPLHSIIIMTIGLGAPYMYVISSGLKLAPVEQFAVVTPSSMIAFSLLLSIIFFKTKIHLNEYIGISIILFGVLLIGFISFGTSSLYSYLFFLLGGAMWAAYTVVSKHYCSSPLYATMIVSFYSLILYLPIYLYKKSFDIFFISPDILIPQLIYQGIFVSIIALFFYSQSVLILGATSGSVFAALVPALATITSALTLNEFPEISSILGLFIISIGMMITVIKFNGNLVFKKTNVKGRKEND
ncbi:MULTISPECIES: DMT family transporter [Acinetobacter]|uniref:DMT family transporter n=1 Tax=Acinetobacter indicus TaxID=756892 RepID=A0A6C0Y7M4_9GAMM|nr:MULTISPECIES: DMT family transporter [Acinetobacter]QIC71725.1 DMT family transporter [Acinetobacter indicus]QKQ71633.1 DMT family transporter [Acinetobacter sp. 10FS3-1]